MTIRLLLVAALVGSVTSRTATTLLASDTVDIRAPGTAPTTQSHDDATRHSSPTGGKGPGRSTVRTLLGLALIAGGVGLLVIEPTQPVQPSQVLFPGIDSLFDAERSGVSGPTYGHADPWWNHVLMTNYDDGYDDGGALMRNIVWRDGRELYSGTIQPYRQRPPAAKYGAVAAIAVGAGLLVWRAGGGGERHWVRAAARPGHVSVRATVGF
jgi:hypothetical protein